MLQHSRMANTKVKFSFAVKRWENKTAEMKGRDK
jgi:hypothetical protein